ncbi:uncharacterized protein LOC116119791 [Pistacia vera]|uniref:uncharacterized protein LOC116119791 n=1 Tax=Pistacia vera TaxID=55513 RepID=UPI0012631957|nr:uncharacterized protein LOC116119791 [Pistacia vera]
MVNKIRLLGVEMSDKMIVEKVLVSVPKRFESKISSLEDSKDLSQISLTELVYALQAQEQRRLMRQEDSNEFAMMAALAAQKGISMQGSNRKYAGDKRGKRELVDRGENRVEEGIIHHVLTAKERDIQRIGAGLDLGSSVEDANSLGTLKRCARTKVHSHHSKHNLQKISSKSSESEQLFVALCYSMQTSGDVWLIDSGCTNHMVASLENFVRLDRTYNSNVKVGNGDYVEAKGIGDVAVQTQAGTKIISSVLFVPEIAQNLLSIAQMLEKNYTLHFQNHACIIKDSEEN